MMSRRMVWLALIGACLLASRTSGQQRIINQGGLVNRPPVLNEGGDLSGFSLFENTPVGTKIYTLRGSDPEGSRVTYFISGDYLSVDSNTGVITLTEPLDRELDPEINVVITIQDEGIREEAQNLISVRRTIQVLDRNDNPPEFRGKPYTFTVSETQAVGETLFTGINIIDQDFGRNAEIDIRCTEQSSIDACETFDIFAEKLEDGKYLGLIILKKALDYETVSSYNLDLEAVDRAEGEDKLASRASVIIKVEDVQDQDPVFLNSPYSATVPEATPQDSEIFEILVRDGDTGKPRDLDVSLDGEYLNYFTLVGLGVGKDGVNKFSLRTTQNKIDREHEDILEEGGLYTFKIIAKEKAEDGQVGAMTETGVTIVVTDVDDETPVFSRQEVTVPVPEDVGADTPLPGLTLEVVDRDVSRNAEFTLSLEPVSENAGGVFYVYPEKAIGKTPVIIRVKDPDRLDHENPEAKKFIFDVVATTPQLQKIKSRVTVLVTDSNDNTPVFMEPSYEFSVNEDAPPDFVIGTILAEDPDSGSYGEVVYSIRGFGSEKFTVNPNTGEIKVASCGIRPSRRVTPNKSCLDYETQKVFSLTYTATDGGGQIATTSLVVNVEDVNDNHPVFNQEEYRRTVRLGDSTFQPPLILKATDKDGPLQGDGRVFYSIKSINTDAVVFEMDPLSGELTMLRPVSVEDTENGRYDLVVRATDQGKPEPLHTDVNVYVNVGTTRNQKPAFKQESYEVSLKEDAAPASEVATVEAKDPDGSDSDLRYSIYSGSKDNFVIDPVTGVITVAKDAVLDIDENGDRYYLVVHVIDNGEPFKQTGETMVNIILEDVNNKAPKFNQESYTQYVLENEPKGFMVLDVNATDADRTADLEFDIIEPIIARDKSGSVLENIAAYDFKSAFNIDPRNGHIVINNKLSYSSAAVIILTLEVVDKNAEVGNQTSTAEATFYIQAFNADSPVFPPPWTPSDPTIQIEVDEELPPGTPLFNLTAKDPLTGQLIQNYQKLETQSSEYSDLIQVSPFGVLISTQRLDFEQFQTISFSVAAIAGLQGEPRRTEAHITINLRDVNDNAPVFESPVYRAEIKEDVLPLTLVTTVKANDADTGEFGKVVYSLEGEGENHFMVHPTTGHIQVKPGNLGRSNLDRETKSRYSLRVIARDTPEGGLTQKSTSVLVEVTLLDVNDSPPQFSQTRYTSVVPENSPLLTPVVQVSAVDPDEGSNNQVTYDFANPSQLQGMLSINKLTGQVNLQSSLTGRGRKEPYIVTIRALDNGTPQQFTDTDLYITIGDVSRNDGVPEFISPKVGEVASVSEEAPVDTFVFQCEAHDPDDPNTANGKLVYSFPDDGSVVHQLFRINPNTGLISTLAALDRETRSEFSLTIEVRDLGTPVQQTTRTLQVVVNDIDDHPPMFNRQRNSVPLTMEVLEETEIGIKVGTVAAVDQDEGRNAEIDYAIIDGNNEDIFEIRSEDNIGNLYLKKRLDREKAGLYTLTIRCFKAGNRGLMSRTKPYDRTKLEELQVKIIVLDKDDNKPRFVEANKTLGVRINSPLYTELAQVVAVDPDPDSSPVRYSIENITYFQPRTDKKEVMAKDVFIVDETTGHVQTNRLYGKYNDGYFEVVIKASNTPDDNDRAADYATLTVFVLQDTDLMKFVFDEDPVKVSKHIGEIKSEIEAAFPRELPLSINIYDTEFYSQGGGSLDFGRTSSCFQVLKDGGSIALSSVQTLFDPKTIRPDLQEKLDKFRVIKVERCANIKSDYTISWVQICILAIGILIGVIAFIAAVTTCCLYSKYKRRIRRSNIRIVEAPVRALIPASLPPGSVVGHPTTARSEAGSNGRIYEWQETALPIDTVSYKSIPR